MCIDVVRGAAERLHAQGERPDPFIRIRKVTASRGKVVRAEPVSQLYERGRIRHRPGMVMLESELFNFRHSWRRDADESPNRTDALVWSIIRLDGVIWDLPMA